MKSRYLITTAIFAVATATPALAQDPPAAQPAPGARAPGDPEIIVTAQRRAQRLQDVPIAVSAFTDQALEERAVSEVAQLSNISPNVTLDGGTPFSASSQVLSAYIRGIGANDFAFNLDPGVGIYLDGVYLARTVGANQDLLDVERIEVLRGPQGTLFGRNTIGGAINIVTRAPGDHFRMQADVTTGSFNRVRVRGTVDLPITDGVSMILSGSFQDRDGYVRHVPYTGPGANLIGNSTPSEAFLLAGYDRDNTEGGDHTWNARARIDFNNHGRFRASLTADYSRTDTNQLPNTVLLTTGFIPGPFAGLNQFDLGPAFGFPIQTALDVITGSSGFLFNGLYNFCIGASPADLAARNAANLCGPRATLAGPNTSRPLADPVLGGANFPGNPAPDLIPYDNRFIPTNIDRSYANGPGFSDLESYGGAATLEFDIAPNLTLKSITAYRELHWDAAMDLDGAPIPALQVSFIMNQWQFSQELQLQGNLLDNRLNYVFGAYYFKEAGDLHDLVPFIEGLLQVDGPNTLSTENYAAFGQIDWRVADWLGFTLGARYTHENKAFEGGQADRNGFNYDLFNCPNFNSPLCVALVGFNDPNEPLRYFIAGVNHKSFNNFSPRAGIQLHPSDNVMVYGSWSRGYKTGGWTTRLSNPLPTAPDFDEEKAESFELGFKSYFLGRRGTFNVALFSTNYTGIQLNFQQGVSPTIQNAGTARIRGAEVELSWAVNNMLHLDSSVGIISAEYRSVLPQSQVAPSPLQAGVFPGADLPKTPHFTFNISPRLRIPLGGTMGSVTLVADYTYTSPLWNDTERTFLLRRQETNMVNASVTWRSPNERWSLTAGVTNLLDERYLVTGQAQIAGGVIYGTYSRPAEWYVRAGVEF
jgi:outer membrane receptor protein involved in Fe transport